jgi:hypothetical protein
VQAWAFSNENYWLSEAALGFKGWVMKANASTDYFKYMMVQK